MADKVDAAINGEDISGFEYDVENERPEKEDVSITETHIEGSIALEAEDDEDAEFLCRILSVPYLKDEYGNVYLYRPENNRETVEDAIEALGGEK